MSLQLVYLVNASCGTSAHIGPIKPLQLRDTSAIFKLKQRSLKVPVSDISPRSAQPFPAIRDARS